MDINSTSTSIYRFDVTKALLASLPLYVQKLKIQIDFEFVFEFEFHQKCLISNQQTILKNKTWTKKNLVRGQSKTSKDKAKTTKQ